MADRLNALRDFIKLNAKALCIGALVGLLVGCSIG
jgi:predicted negative regulator of RcsB-dependent stress response